VTPAILVVKVSKVMLAQQVGRASKVRLVDRVSRVIQDPKATKETQVSRAILVLRVTPVLIQK